MSGEVYDLLDELATRGRRLRGRLPGDVHPYGLAGPTDDWLEDVWALFLASRTNAPTVPSAEDVAR